jgi:hypothetical protein
MRCSELTNVRIARDDHHDNEQDRLLPWFPLRQKGAAPVKRHCVD